MRARWVVPVVVVAMAGSISGCDLLPSSRTTRRPTPQYTPRPIPTAPDSPTRTEDFALIAGWERRNMRDAYNQVGRRDPRWDEAAREFISQHSLVRLWNAEELVPEGRRLLALGCDDPLIQYLVGLDLWLTDIESIEASFLFELAVEGMKQVPYPRGIARFVVSALFRDHARTSKGWAQAPLVPLEVQWFREAMSDGSYQAGDEVVLAYHLRFGTGRSMLDRNQEAVYLAVEGNPHLDRWVKLLMSGRRHFFNAWAARGTGYAHEVTEEGWEVFRQELALERKDLVEAWRLRPDRPEIAEAMMFLVHLQDFEGETVRMWFDRAVALQMDYVAAYWTMLDDLEPRWHGSHEEMLRFARECVETERYDTPVPQILFDALGGIESNEHDAGHPGEGVYRRPEVFPLVQRVVDGYLGVVQEKRRRREFNTRFVLAAHKAGRNEEACERILAMDGDLDAALTPSAAGGPRLLAGRICAEASAGDRLEAAESRFQEGERDVPLGLLQQAASRESRPLAQAYLRHRIAALKLEGELAKGDWVPFLPTNPDLAGWEVIRGRWTFEDQGSVLGESASKGMMIRSAARVGPDFEVRGEYELVKSTNDWYQAGVVVGDPRAQRRSWFSLRMKRNPWMGEVATIGTGFYAPHVQAEVPVPLKGHFRLVCQEGRVQAEVNGAVVATNYESPDGLATLADALVGFAGPQDGNVFSVRYRNVELRRVGPSPGAASP